MPNYAPIPKRLDILGISWRVLQTPERWAAVLTYYTQRKEEPPTDGEMDSKETTISLDPSLTLENSWITLLHEVEHVLEELVQGDETEAEARERYIGATDTPRFIFYRDTFGVGLKKGSNSKT